jgi:hypothetical protein
MYVITSSTNDYRTFRVIANKEQKGFQFEINRGPARAQEIR